MKRAVHRILAEHEVKVVPTAVQRRERQTFAGRTLQGVYETHGEAHLRDVLTLILESEGNGHALIAPIILAVSDILAAHRPSYEHSPTAWLRLFDTLDLVAIHARVRPNRKAVAPRAAIATVIFAELWSQCSEIGPPPSAPSGSSVCVSSVGGE